MMMFFFIDAIYNSLNIDEDLSLGQLVSFMEEHGQNYPLTLGEDMNDEQKMRMLLFIAHKIFVNFKSSHNNPLDVQYFKVPWTLMTDPSFVQI
ncbi:Protein ABHD16A [Armadillidium vulgare]|nr:Protein ABHD16A [Armadillidium vulgare]